MPPPGISADKKQEYIDVLEKMYGSASWEKVRSRYGWSENFKPDQEFVAFLEEQEKAMGSLLLEMGFLK